MLVSLVLPLWMSVLYLTLLIRENFGVKAKLGIAIDSLTKLNIC